MAGRSFGANEGPLETRDLRRLDDCKTFSPNRINKGRESSATGDPFPSLLPSLAAPRSARFVLRLRLLSVSAIVPEEAREGNEIPPCVYPSPSPSYFPPILTHRQTRWLLILFSFICRKPCRPPKSSLTPMSAFLLRDVTPRDVTYIFEAKATLAFSEATR